MEEKRSFRLKKKDWLVLGLLLVLAAGSWLFYQIGYREPVEQNLAVVMVDGKEAVRLNLLEESDRVFSLRGISGFRCPLRSRITKSGLYRWSARTTSAKTRAFCPWRARRRFACPTGHP